MTIFSDNVAEERKAQKKKTGLNKYREGLRKQAIGDLYKTEAGRTFLWSLLEKTAAYGQTPFQGENTHLTSFNCGQQAVGQSLMAEMIEVSPVLFTEMMKEMTLERSNPNPNLNTDTAPEFDFGREPTAGVRSDSVKPEPVGDEPAFYS